MFIQKFFCYIFTVFILNYLALGQFYLNDGVIKFITGLGLPIDVNMPGSSLSWFANVQVFYKLPNNISYYEPYKIVEKRSLKNTFNRHIIYQALTMYLNRLGFSGRECLHRFICEIGRRKLNWNYNSLIEEIIIILFSLKEDFQKGLEEYKNSMWQGLYNNTDCQIIYSKCSVEENSIFLT